MIVQKCAQRRFNIEPFCNNSLVLVQNQQFWRGGYIVVPQEVRSVKVALKSVDPVELVLLNIPVPRSEFVLQCDGHHLNAAVFVLVVKRLEFGRLALAMTAGTVKTKGG